MFRIHHAIGGCGLATRIHSEQHSMERNKLRSLSSSAEHVELCLFGGPCDRSLDEQRIDLQEVDGHIWHAYLPDVTPGQHYGYRVHGEWNPNAGLWHNDTKVLLDPYAPH